MVSERKVARWFRRAAKVKSDSQYGFVARQAWKRIERAVAARKQNVLTALRQHAALDSYRRRAECKILVADHWAATRDPKSRHVTRETAALAAAGASRLLTAALNGQLHEVWSSEPPAMVEELLDDIDDDVRANTFSALACLASSPDTAQYRQAQQLLANRWVATRDESLRPIVISTGALGSCGTPRLVTAALHGTLAGAWSPIEADQISAMLDDVDNAVRAGAAGACRGADGECLAALWNICLEASVSHHNTKDSPWWSVRLPTLLLQNPNPAPTRVVDALWRAWLDTADQSVWEALRTWKIPATQEPAMTASLIAVDPDFGRLLQNQAIRARIFEAIPRKDHPLGQIARDKVLASKDHLVFDELCALATIHNELVPFCVGNRLAPRDPVKRVAFFLLTGQPEQYRGIDPDGSLLALAYAAADADTRTRLQRGMRTSMGLDLIRVLVGADRRSRIQQMTEGEIKYLAEQLADRRDWADLWSIVQDLPVARGLQLMPLFADWEPRDVDSRQLFAELRQTEPHAIRQALDAIRADWPMGMRQAVINFQGRVNDVSFAPDGPLLAVAGSSRVAGLVDLSRGRLVERYEGFAASVGRVLHLGGGVFVAAERTNGPHNACSLVRCRNHRQKVLHETAGSITSIAMVGRDGSFAAGTRGGELLLSSAGSRVITSISIRQLGLDPTVDWPRSVAGHPDSGRLAILGRGLAVIDTAASVTLGHGWQQTVIARAAFADRDSLVTGDQNGTIRLMRRVGNRFNAGPSAVVAGLGGLATVPQRNHIVAADRSGVLTFFDRSTLATVGYAGDPSHAKATSVHVSPTGEFLAVGYDGGFTELFDLRISELPTLMQRPLVNMVPAHLGVVTSALRHRAMSEPIRRLLELVRAMLEHRFRFDIELGDLVALSAGEYDISL